MRQHRFGRFCRHVWKDPCKIRTLDQPHQLSSIVQDDVASPHLNQTQRSQRAQGTAHRLPGEAQIACEVLLRDFHLDDCPITANSAMRLCKRQKYRCEPGRSLSRVALEKIDRVSQAMADRLCQTMKPGGVAHENRNEMNPTNVQDFNRFHSRYAGGSGMVVKQRHFTYEFATAKKCDNDLAAFVGDLRYLELASEDDDQAIAPIPLAEEDLALTKAPELGTVQNCVKRF